MKKNGFTLAEVLITLAIIGVIATMTLPALMTNTAEQQAKSGLKKGINTLTEAGQLSNAIDGFDYGSLLNTDTNAEAQSMFGLLATRAAIDFQKSGLRSTTRGISTYAGNGNYVVYFRDGSSVQFLPNSTLSSDPRMKNILDDGMPQGFTGLYDYNGDKKPNMVSNCQGTTSGLASGNDHQANNVALATQCQKNISGTQGRVIKDQFGVRFRGGYVVPNGAAARWAFEN